MPAGEIRDAIERTGKFRVIKQCSEGQNAYAFEAFHKHLNRNVFLKLYEYSSSIAVQVLREPRALIEATRTFPSDNVVSLFDTELLDVGDEKYLCLQMEFVSGNSMLSLLQNNEIGQQDAVRMIAGVLSGLAHLHSRRILHRDLKPANVMIDDNGIAKIADFGSVAILPQGQTSVTASKHSALYVPPETCPSQQSYGFRSDLYQVGMVLYELVNGPLEYDLGYYVSETCLTKLRRARIPYSLDNECDRSLAADASIKLLAQQQKLLEYGRPSRPYFSPQLCKVVKKACQPDPMNRFSSAQEFCTRLMQSNVPNWKAIDDHTFRASNWKGSDWEVSDAPCIVVKKSRRDRENYRRLASQKFQRIQEAFEFVESI
jgi:serine/threonine protein kinase